MHLRNNTICTIRITNGQRYESTKRSLDTQISLQTVTSKIYFIEMVFLENSFKNH